MKKNLRCSNCDFYHSFDYYTQREPIFTAEPLTTNFRYASPLFRFIDLIMILSIPAKNQKFPMKQAHLLKEVALLTTVELRLRETTTKILIKRFKPELF